MKSVKKLTALLVAVLMVLVIIPASANSDTGNMELLLLDSSKNALDASTLVAGDIFYVPLTLSDFGGKFTSGFVAIGFDPTKVSLVSATGTPAGSNAALNVFERPLENLVVGANPEEEDPGFKVFNRIGLLTDNTNGSFRISYYIDTAAADFMGTKYIVVEEEKFELLSLRFKVLDGATGDLGIKIVENNIYLEDSTTEVFAKMTDITPAGRFVIGQVEPTEPKVVSFADKSQTVAYNTSKEDVIALLGETIVATLDNGEEQEFAVEWACDDYDAAVAGDYTFTGTVTEVEGIDLNGVVPTAVITVEEEDEVSVPYEIQNLEFTITEDDGALVKFDIAKIDESYEDVGEADKVIVSIVRINGDVEVPVVVITGKASITESVEFTLSDVQEGETYGAHISVVDGFAAGGNTGAPLAAPANDTATYQAK